MIVWRCSVPSQPTEEREKEGASGDALARPQRVESLLRVASGHIASAQCLFCGDNVRQPVRILNPSGSSSVKSTCKRRSPAFLSRGSHQYRTLRTLLLRRRSPVHRAHPLSELSPSLSPLTVGLPPSIPFPSPTPWSRPVRLTAWYQSYTGHGELESAAPTPPPAPWRAPHSKGPWSSTRCIAMAGPANGGDVFQCALYHPEVLPLSPHRHLVAAVQCRRKSRHSER